LCVRCIPTFPPALLRCRIQKDILGDLTREILADMGIKVMGDVIAILKQAKVVSEQVVLVCSSKAVLFNNAVS